jgi:hypothetical protein
MEGFRKHDQLNERCWTTTLWLPPLNPNVFVIFLPQDVDHVSFPTQVSHRHTTQGQSIAPTNRWPHCLHTSQLRPFLPVPRTGQLVLPLENQIWRKTKWRNFFWRKTKWRKLFLAKNKMAEKIAKIKKTTNSKFQFALLWREKFDSEISLFSDFRQADADQSLKRCIVHG